VKELNSSAEQQLCDNELLISDRSQFAERE